MNTVSFAVNECSEESYIRYFTFQKLIRHHIAYPLNNGEIALWLPMNSLMYSKHVSQKRNQSMDKNQWYNILLNFIL